MKKWLWLLPVLVIIPLAQGAAAAEPEVLEMKPYAVKSENVYKKISANGCYFYQYTVEDGVTVPESSDVLCSAQVLAELDKLYSGRNHTGSSKEEEDSGGGKDDGGGGGGQIDARDL